jgi:hypothetical protein
LKWQLLFLDPSFIFFLLPLKREVPYPALSFLSCGIWLVWYQDLVLHVNSYNFLTYWCSPHVRPDVLILYPHFFLLYVELLYLASKFSFVLGSCLFLLSCFWLLLFFLTYSFIVYILWLPQATFSFISFIKENCNWAEETKFHSSPWVLIMKKCHCRRHLEDTVLEILSWIV